MKTGSLFLVALLKQALSYLTFITLNILLLKNVLPLIYNAVIVDDCKITMKHYTILIFFND